MDEVQERKDVQEKDTDPHEAELDALRREVESLKQKAEENWQHFLRSRADFDNYRKRMERDVAAMVRRGKRDILLQLLEVVDNFHRALAAPGSDAVSLKEGLEMVLRQMEGVLKGQGVQAVESVGKPFDPSLHEAVAVFDSPEVDVETVTDEIQKGYTLEGELLRAARVRVARPVKAEASGGAAEAGETQAGGATPDQPVGG